MIWVKKLVRYVKTRRKRIFFAQSFHEEDSRMKESEIWWPEQNRLYQDCTQKTKTSSTKARCYLKLFLSNKNLYFGTLDCASVDTRSPCGSFEQFFARKKCLPCSPFTLGKKLKVKACFILRVRHFEKVNDQTWKSRFVGVVMH